MKLDNENWKELDINVDSLWIMGPRAKGGKRANVYHGNFAPQIPNQMIRRYTEEGGVVVDMFTGSGTTLVECEILNRNFIGFDINQDIIDYANGIMVEHKETLKYNIHNCDVSDTESVSQYIESDLGLMGKKTVDLIIVHPPYWNIIKFTDKPEDFSNIDNLQEFLDKFKNAVSNFYKYLKMGKYMVLVVGDIYRNGEVVPLGFYMMNTIKSNFPCKMKGIVVKDMIGNRGKLGTESLWRYRALKSDNFIFKHEYIFVFKKTSE